VQLRDGEDAAAVAAEHHTNNGAQVEHVYATAIDGYGAAMSDQAAAAVAADPRVVSVVRDRRVHVAAETIPTGVGRSDAVGLGTVLGGTSKSVDADIAIVDTGIDLNQVDLNARAGTNCVSPGAAPQDGFGHGTHVAGIAAAKDDGNGVVGVAPGARVWAVKVLGNDGYGTWQGVACGLDWVAANAATIHVANLSLAGSGSNSTCTGSRGGNADVLHEAVCGAVAAGVTVVVAAGNESQDASNVIPAAYDEVITVSALGDSDGRAGGLGAKACGEIDDAMTSFSNYGPAVDMIAPGACILSTRSGGGTVVMSGTSMAAPHVAGAAADYLVGHPGATPAQVKAALRANGNTGWTGDKDAFKEPLLDLTFLGGSGPPTPPPSGGGVAPPTISASGTPGTWNKAKSSKVDLTWTGASTPKVEIRRDGALIITKKNNGAYTDKFNNKIGAGQTRTYNVCETGGSVCSADVVVKF
jgi:subtilisin family serine protease